MTSNETWLKSWICALLHFTDFFRLNIHYTYILLEYSVKMRMRVIDIPYVTLSMCSKHIRDVTALQSAARSTCISHGSQREPNNDCTNSAWLRLAVSVSNINDIKSFLARLWSNSVANFKNFCLHVFVWLFRKTRGVGTASFIMFSISDSFFHIDKRFLLLGKLFSKLGFVILKILNFNVYVI